MTTLLCVHLLSMDVRLSYLEVSASRRKGFQANLVNLTHAAHESHHGRGKSNDTRTIFLLLTSNLCHILYDRTGIVLLARDNHLFYWLTKSISIFENLPLDDCKDGRNLLIWRFGPFYSCFDFRFVATLHTSTNRRALLLCFRYLPKTFEQ
jgi:hypothetical protein